MSEPRLEPKPIEGGNDAGRLIGILGACEAVEQFGGGFRRGFGLGFGRGFGLGLAGGVRRPRVIRAHGSGGGQHNSESKTDFVYHARKLTPPRLGGQNEKMLKAETALTRRRGCASALAGLETLLRLVDDVDAALATHEAIVAMAIAQGLEGIADFHGCTRVFDAAGETHGRRSGAAMPESSPPIKGRFPSPALAGEGGAIGRRKTPVFDGLWRRMRVVVIPRALTPTLSRKSGRGGLRFASVVNPARMAIIAVKRHCLGSTKPIEQIPARTPRRGQTA